MSMAVRRRKLKSEAEKIVFSNFPSCFFLSVVFVLLLCGASSIFRFIDVFTFRVFSQKLYFCIQALGRFFCLLLLLPLFRGYLLFFYNLTLDRKCNIFVVLSGFSSKNQYLLSLRKSFSVILLVATALISSKTFSVFSRYLLDEVSFFAENSFASLALRIVYLSFNALIFVAIFGASAFYVIDECDFKQSFYLMKYYKAEFSLLVLSFFPHVIIAYFLPVIWGLYFVPYFLVTASLFINFVISEKTAPDFAEFHEI